jgi:hypothetical protein
MFGYYNFRPVASTKGATATVGNDMSVCAQRISQPCQHVKICEIGSIDMSVCAKRGFLSSSGEARYQRGM